MYAQNVNATIDEVIDELLTTTTHMFQSALHTHDGLLHLIESPDTQKQCTRALKRCLFHELKRVGSKSFDIGQCFMVLVGYLLCH